jgi:hypothetical protein
VYSIKKNMETLIDADKEVSLEVMQGKLSVYVDVSSPEWRAKS